VINLQRRVDALKAAFKEEFDGFIITNEVNMLYLTGFLGAAMMLIPAEKETVLYVKSTNYGAAKDKVRNCRVEQVKVGENLPSKVAKQVNDKKLKKLAFDTMSFTTHQKLSKSINVEAKLEPKSRYIWQLRTVKDVDELQRIRKAAKLTVKGMEAAFEIIKAGLPEYEVAAEIEYAMRTSGSYGTAFDTIVASGPRSAYPHGGCGEKKLERGDLVVVDIGAVYKNYRSDMTRTFVVGNSSTKQRRMFEVVKDAQETAFQMMRDSVKAAESDSVARKIIGEAGYGEYFIHGLGHGIGLETHEQPYLNSNSKDVLKEGYVVTDEPGIYLDGLGGVRIEDTVLVKEKRAERLTDGLYVLNA
jgi:Xaa-Pro aminopeptidase